MATIFSFVKQYEHSFDPETTSLMGEAFDACKMLGAPTANAREAIADRIIDEAATGERDISRLIEAALRTPPK